MLLSKLPRSFALCDTKNSLSRPSREGSFENFVTLYRVALCGSHGRCTIGACGFQNFLGNTLAGKVTRQNALEDINKTSGRISDNLKSSGFFGGSIGLVECYVQSAWYRQHLHTWCGGRFMTVVECRKLCKYIVYI